MQVADTNLAGGASVSQTRLRVSGGLLGAGMSGFVAAGAIALDVWFVAVVGGIGVVVGAVLGAWFAPRVVSDEQPLGTALWLSIVAVPAGGAVVGLLFALGISIANPDGSGLLAVPVTTFFSLALYPIFAPVVLPMTIVGVLAGRRLVRLPPRTAALALAGLLAADVAVLALGPAVVRWLSG